MRTDAQAKKDSLIGWQKTHVIEGQTYTIAIQFLEQSVKDAEAEVEAMQAHVASLKETLSEFNDDYAKIVEQAKPKTKAKAKPKADKPKEGN
jgi:cell division protein FtsB